MLHLHSILYRPLVWMGGASMSQYSITYKAILCILANVERIEVKLIDLVLVLLGPFFLLLFTLQY
jgi:hypothetical protein